MAFLLLLVWIALVLRESLGQWGDTGELQLLKRGYILSNGDPSQTPLPRLLVVTLTSVNRKEYYDAVGETYMNELPTLMLTESATPKCKLCGGARKEGRNGALYSHTRYTEYSKESPGLEYFSWKSLEWKSAQQRPLQALKKTLVDFSNQNHEWVLLIDDDSYVHKQNMMKMLRGLNASEAIMLGNRIGGGAGFLISKGATQALLQPSNNVDYSWDVDTKKWKEQGDSSGQTSVLDKCIEASLGGRYCFFHSDWLIKRCADAAGVKVETRLRMYQDCPFAIQGLTNGTDTFNSDIFNTVLRSRMWKELLTCHRIDPHIMRSLHKIKVAHDKQE